MFPASYYTTLNKLYSKTKRVISIRNEFVFVTIQPGNCHSERRLCGVRSLLLKTHEPQNTRIEATDSSFLGMTKARA